MNHQEKADQVLDNHKLPSGSKLSKSIATALKEAEKQGMMGVINGTFPVHIFANAFKKGLLRGAERAENWPKECEAEQDNAVFGPLAFSQLADAIRSEADAGTTERKSDESIDN